MKVLALYGSLIEGLYVLPGTQNMGYGIKRLQFAISLCTGMSVLWISENQAGAGRFDRRMGFRETGRRKTGINRPDEVEVHLTRVFPQVTG